MRVQEDASLSIRHLAICTLQVIVANGQKPCHFFTARLFFTVQETMHRHNVWNQLYIQCIHEIMLYILLQSDR